MQTEEAVRNGIDEFIIAIHKILEEFNLPILCGYLAIGSTTYCRTLSSRYIFDY